MDRTDRILLVRCGIWNSLGVSIRSSSVQQSSSTSHECGLEHHGFNVADQVYLQDLPQLPYMPVSESPYASPSLYKCASDPSSNPDTDRPHMSPAQLAGVHVAQGSQGAASRDAAAMFTYSSEPTAMAPSSMVHPAGARLTESQFQDVAWVRLRHRLFLRYGMHSHSPEDAGIGLPTPVSTTIAVFQG